MTLIEAIILGIIQGLTEFLPVSSSGHLELGKEILNVELEENLGFTVMVHFATVLSTITVFWKEIRIILRDVFKFKWNDSTIYVAKILLSMIPVLIVGVFFQDQVEALFIGNLVWVGSALLLISDTCDAPVIIDPLPFTSEKLLEESFKITWSHSPAEGKGEEIEIRGVRRVCHDE